MWLPQIELTCYVAFPNQLSVWEFLDHKEWINYNWTLSEDNSMDSCI